MNAMVRDLFRIGSGSISAVLTLRVAAAVGVPMLGFLLAGQPLGAVVAAASAMFTTLSDIGTSVRERASTMLATTLVLLAGGSAACASGERPMRMRRSCWVQH